jgi:hypothetical protein
MGRGGGVQILECSPPRRRRAQRLEDEVDAPLLLLRTTTWSLRRCGRVQGGAPFHFPCSCGGEAARRRDAPPPVPLLWCGGGVSMKGRRALLARPEVLRRRRARGSASRRRRRGRCSSSLPSGFRRGRTVGVRARATPSFPVSPYVLGK